MQDAVSWDDWRYFLAVAQAGSLSGAARALGVNQSTVFRRVARLEDQLGARLFDRLPRGYVLTEVGEAVQPAARRLADDLMALTRSVAGADHQLTGVIRFTTVFELFQQVVPHLAAFRARYPGIQLDVSTDARVLRLGRHEADVALRPGGPPTEPDVVGRRLRPSPVGVYASEAYLAAHGRPAGPADLEGHTVVRYQRGGAATPASWSQGLTVAAWVDSKAAQVAACRAGLGLADLPAFAAGPDLVPVFPLATLDLDLWLLVHMDLRRAARIRVFVDWLTEALQPQDLGDGG